jgi:hypothetical protein
MVKVYVATFTYRYEGTQLIGVYTTEKRAKGACSRFQHRGDFRDVVTVELNADYDYGEKVRDGS